MDQTNAKSQEIVPSNAKSNEENKTKTGHGNGLGGLVLIGALSVAALVAIFAMERKKMKDSISNITNGSSEVKPENEGDDINKSRMDEEPASLSSKICRILFILAIFLYLIFSLSSYPVSRAILPLFRKV